MKYSTASIALMAGAAIAAPTNLIAKRAVTDAEILNFALTLEHLEATFYAQALANYTEADFTSAGFSTMYYENVQELAYDEATHVSFLTSALKAAGASPVAACTYDFGITTVTEFATLASILEGVGVSAYLGAAALISDKTYLTAAGSILTVEARHNAFIRNGLMPAQAAFPAPFDSPLDLDMVYTLAAPFIVSCPSTNAALPVSAFPSLAVEAGTLQPVRQGQYITFQTSKEITGSVYAAFMTVTGPVFATIISSTSGTSFVVDIPHGVTGQSYLLLSNSSTTVTDAEVLAGPAIVNVEAYYLYQSSPAGVSK